MYVKKLRLLVRLLSFVFFVSTSICTLNSILIVHNVTSHSIRLHKKLSIFDSKGYLFQFPFISIHNMKKSR